MNRFSPRFALIAGLLLGALITLAATTALTSRRPEATQVGELTRAAAGVPVLEAIRNRRTVRAFKPEPVPEEDLMAILEAAHFAATAGNQQPWKFLVVRDRETLDRLEREALDWYMENVRSSEGAAQRDLEETRSGAQQYLEHSLSAPVYVALLVDREARYPDYIVYDGSLAAGNLMLAARALGYGTAFFTSFFPEQEMREFFNIPARYQLICFTPIGVPQEWPQTPEKKDLYELVVFESF